MPDNHHIPIEHLAQLLSHECPAANEAALVAHLDDCPACQHELEQAAGAPQWWNDARRFLGQPDEASAPDGEPSDIALDFLAPTDDPTKLGRVGPYEIAGVIGRGGTGIVLKAFEPALHRFVALKLLAPHLATSAAARKRFAREAQAAAAVAHEHIVPIYAVDEHRGLPYMVMRYVPGRSLQERLDKQGTLGLVEILRIGRQTAAGLAAAHAQGLVHRDIKPANILLEHGVERVLLTDFGLARAVDDASLTCSGMVAGTPQYMAPEQARGEAIDHRTDLFSLGSVLYAMCAGHSPFRAETTMGVLHRLCTDAPRPLRQINPQVPEWFERIVRKLHDKQPSRRYQTAAEVADVLEAHLARLQRPGAALREPLWQRTRDRFSDFWHGGTWRRKAFAAAIPLVLGFVALTYAVWTSRFQGTNESPPTSSHDGSASSAAAQSEAAAEASGLGWQPRAHDFDEVRAVLDRLEQNVFARSSSEPREDEWSASVLEVQQNLDALEREFAEATGGDSSK